MALPDNPVENILNIFLKMGRDEAHQPGRLGEPVSQYDFIKAVLLISHMQVSQMTLATAIHIGDSDKIGFLVTDIVSKISDLTQIAQAIGLEYQAQRDGGGTPHE